MANRVVDLPDTNRITLESIRNRHVVYLVDPEGNPDRTDLSTTLDQLRLYILQDIQASGAAFPDATTELAGKVELATIAESEAGTDSVRVVTPSGVRAYVEGARDVISNKTLRFEYIRREADFGTTRESGAPSAQVAQNNATRITLSAAEPNHIFVPFNPFVIDKEVQVGVESHLYFFGGLEVIPRTRTTHIRVERLVAFRRAGETEFGNYVVFNEVNETVNRDRQHTFPMFGFGQEITQRLENDATRPLYNIGDEIKIAFRVYGSLSAENAASIEGNVDVFFLQPRARLFQFEEFTKGEKGDPADNVTAVDVKTLYESNADTNAYTDAEKTKLAGLSNQQGGGGGGTDLDSIPDSTVPSGIDRFLVNERSLPSGQAVTTFEQTDSTTQIYQNTDPVRGSSAYNWAAVGIQRIEINNKGTVSDFIVRTDVGVSPPREGGTFLEDGATISTFVFAVQSSDANGVNYIAENVSNDLLNFNLEKQIIINLTDSTELGGLANVEQDNKRFATVAQVRTALNVEDGATGDQSGAEIKTAYEGQANTNAYTDAEKTKLAGLSNQQGGGLSSVSSNGTLSGDGTSGSPLGVANPFTDADETKLDGIEARATADQSGAEIKAAYEGQANTNAYTDGEKTKLSGIEARATADQSGAEIKTAYEDQSNTNAYTDVEKTKLAGIENNATADQSAAEIKAALETLGGAARLDASAVKNLPQPTGGGTGASLATQAQFDEGSSVLAPTVNQTKDAIAATSTILVQWNGSTDPTSDVQVGEAAVAGAGTLPNPYSASEDRWQLSAPGSATNTKRAIRWTNDFVDWKRFLACFDMSFGRSSTTTVNFFFGSNNDLTANAPTGHGFTLSLGNDIVNRGNRLALYLGINEAAEGGSFSFTTAGAEAFNGADISYRSNVGVLLPDVVDTRFRLAIVRNERAIRVYVNNIHYVTFNITEAENEAGTIAGANRFGFGWGSPTQNTYIYSMLVGNPDLAELEPSCNILAPPTQSGGGLTEQDILELLDDEDRAVASINQTATIRWSGATIGTYVDAPVQTLGTVLTPAEIAHVNAAKLRFNLGFQISQIAGADPISFRLIVKQGTTTIHTDHFGSGVAEVDLLKNSDPITFQLGIRGRGSRVTGTLSLTNIHINLASALEEAVEDAAVKALDAIVSSLQSQIGDNEAEIEALGTPLNSVSSDGTLSGDGTSGSPLSVTNPFTDADETKLDGIEARATADQTGAEIKTAYEGQANTNAYTDAEKTKLSGLSSDAGLTSVTSDDTLNGEGTSANPLAVASPFTAEEKTKLSGLPQNLIDQYNEGQVEETVIIDDDSDLNTLFLDIDPYQRSDTEVLLAKGTMPFTQWEGTGRPDNANSSGRFMVEYGAFRASVGENAAAYMILRDISTGKIFYKMTFGTQTALPTTFAVTAWELLYEPTRTLSQAAYDALAEKDENTLYLIPES